MGNINKNWILPNEEMNPDNSVHFQDFLEIIRRNDYFTFRIVLKDMPLKLNGYYPLRLAAQCGHAKMVKDILTELDDKQFPAYCQRALSDALQYGFVDVTQILLDDNRINVFDLACKSLRIVVEEYVNYNFGMSDFKYGRTHSHLLNDYKDCISLLIEKITTTINEENEHELIRAIELSPKILEFFPEDEKTIYYKLMAGV